jgi:hypothetical protein
MSFLMLFRSTYGYYSIQHLLHKRTPLFSQSAGAYLYENTGSEINNHRRECVVCLTRGEPHLFDLLHQRPSSAF